MPKSDPEKIRKIHKKASVAESFLSPVKDTATTAVFMINFQKIFRTAFLQEHIWTAASIVST